MRYFLILFIAITTVFGQTEHISLPPYTVLEHENWVFTEDHFGTSYHYWPYDWYANGFPVPYNSYPADHRNENPKGEAALELLNQYDTGTYYRNFYPMGNVIWDPVQGIGQETLRGLLDEMDYHYQNGKRFIWTLSHFNYSNTSRNWGLDLNSSDYEQAVFDFWTDLWTSTYTNPGGLGFTVANHPVEFVIEFANEEITATTANNFKNSYARTLRTVYKLAEQYKPAARLISFCVQGGNGYNLTQILRADASTIAGLSPNGDDGTGKTAAHYLDILAWHYYQEGMETKSRYDEDIANNAFVSRNNMFLYQNHLNAIEVEMQHNPNSPLYGLTLRDIEIWNTESGISPVEAVDADQGGIRWFMMEPEERFNNLLRWFAPSLFLTSDGNGGPGVSLAYKSDLPGYEYQVATFGTVGNIGYVERGDSGRIRFRTTNSPLRGWLENMSLVITGPVGGWPDLGLSEGQKKRFSIHVVNGSINLLELQATTYSAPPSNTPTYTEYQLSTSPYPEEWERFVNLVTGGPVSFGYVHYPDAEYPGMCLVVEGQGIWYTTRTGEIKKWSE